MRMIRISLLSSVLMIASLFSDRSAAMIYLGAKYF